MKKLLALSVLFLLVSILVPKKTLAQGTFSCTFLGPRQGCVWANANCDSDSEPTNNYCSPFTNIDECNNAPATNCVPKEDAQCTAAGGECRRLRSGAGNLCPDAYEPTPLGGVGELGCTTYEACCRPLSAGCESVGINLRCSPGYTRCPEGAGRCCIDTNDCPIFDPGGNVPEVEVPIFCVGDDPSDTTTDSDSKKLATAIGCIPIGTGQEFISFILRWAIGIAGGIAFLLILVAGFQIVTSSGDPKKLQSGRELLTAAIAGLMLLILSVFILRLIGFDLLRIPGL